MDPAAVDPWAWHAHPDVWALVGLLLGSWVFAIRRLGPRWAVPGEAHVTGRQIRWFVGGVAVTWLFADWPVHELSERFLLSVHMVQHAVFTLVVPPMLLLGTPAWLVRGLLVRRPAVLALARRLTKPLVAGIVFNAVVAGSHAPALVDASLRNEFVHFAVHAVLVSAALAMWFPVVNRLPELPQLGQAGRMVYLFLQSVLPTIPASFLTFAEGPVYRFYAEVPRIWGMSVVEDQQVAGAVMKLGAGSFLWAIIIVLFFRWYATDVADRTPRRSRLTMDDVEREFARSTPPSSSVR